MAVMSKRFFEKFTKGATCHEVLHPQFENCIETQIYMFKNSLKGCFKFFLAIYVLDLIIKRKKIDKAYLEQHVKNFFKSYVYGLLFTNVLYSSLCLWRNLIGSFHYYSAIFIPGTLGGSAIFFESPVMKNLNSMMFFALTLEAMVRYLSGTNIITRSVPKDTFCFMIYNSIFLYLLKHNPLAKEACTLWFFNPKKTDKREKNIEEIKCKNVIFSQDLLQEGFKYLTAGYSYQIVRYLVKNVGKMIQKPSTFITNLFSKKALKTGLFFSSYVTIYKVMCRVLQEFYEKENLNHTLIAGFLAGISYCIDPNLQINVLPLSMVLQILWINIRTKYKIPKWYLKEIFFAICTGILLHCYILAPEYSPKYVDNTINAATNGKAQNIIKNFNDYINNKMNMDLIS